MPARLEQGWTRPEVFAAPSVPISSEQLALFPRKALIELPRRSGADIFQFVEADNNLKYHLKLDRADRYTRASEWICHQLARMVGVPVPNCEFIQTFNGDIAFGSENVGSVFREIETFRLLNQSSIDELGRCSSGIQTALSIIHAFDVFVDNIDRHERNFVSVERNGFLDLLAIDFSRALFWRWPLNGFQASNEATGETWIGLRERHGFDCDAAIALTSRLAAVTADHVDGFLRQMPPHWLPEAIGNELRTYCRNGGWAARVAALRRGLEDGSIV